MATQLKRALMLRSFSVPLSPFAALLSASSSTAGLEYSNLMDME